MSTRYLLSALVAGVAALVLGAPLAGAGNTPVDDYWRDQAVVATPTSATLVDDYFRDPATIAVPTSGTLVDDYFRDAPIATATQVAANPVVDDYFRDAPTVVTTSGGGFHWADFGIGIAVAFGTMLILLGLGLGVRALRLSGDRQSKSAGIA